MALLSKKRTLLLFLLAAAGCWAAPERVTTPWQGNSMLHNRTRAALEHLWKAPLAAEGLSAEARFSAAYKYQVPHARNWNRLSHKLTTAGSNITVVAYGGSVTVGHSVYNSSWPEELIKWMEKAFPTVTFHLINLSRSASVAFGAALCYYHSMPEDPDLVLVEYNANGCSAGQCMDFLHPQVVGYEYLIRKIATKAPSAAMLSLAVFSFKTGSWRPYHTTGETWNADAQPPTLYISTYMYAPLLPPSVFACAADRHNYCSMGEDLHAVIAKRYDIPMVSIRDALFDVLFDETAMRRTFNASHAELFLDHIHPTLAGANLYGAGFVAWAVRHLVTAWLLQPTLQHYSVHEARSHDHKAPRRHLMQESSLHGFAAWQRLLSVARLSHTQGAPEDVLKDNAGWRDLELKTSSSGSKGAGKGVLGWAYDVSLPQAMSTVHTLRLPKAVSPDAARFLDQDTYCAIDKELQSRVVMSKGWEWAREGRCNAVGCSKDGYKSYMPGTYIQFTLDTSQVLNKTDKTEIAAGSKLALVMLLMRQGSPNTTELKERMGIVLVTCVSGCTCQPLEIDGLNTKKSSELDIEKTEVSAHAQCVIKVTNLQKTTTGGHKFKLYGWAIAAYRAKPYL